MKKLKTIFMFTALNFARAPVLNEQLFAEFEAEFRQTNQFIPRNSSLLTTYDNLCNVNNMPMDNDVASALKQANTVEGLLQQFKTTCLDSSRNPVQWSRKETKQVQVCQGHECFKTGSKSDLEKWAITQEKALKDRDRWINRVIARYMSNDLSSSIFSLKGYKCILTYYHYDDKQYCKYTETGCQNLASCTKEQDTSRSAAKLVDLTSRLLEALSGKIGGLSVQKEAEETFALQRKKMEDEKKALDSQRAQVRAASLDAISRHAELYSNQYKEGMVKIIQEREHWLRERIEEFYRINKEVARLLSLDDAAGGENANALVPAPNRPNDTVNQSAENASSTAGSQHEDEHFSMIDLIVCSQLEVGNSVRNTFNANPQQAAGRVSARSFDEATATSVVENGRPVSRRGVVNNNANVSNQAQASLPATRNRFGAHIPTTNSLDGDDDESYAAASTAQSIYDGQYLVIADDSNSQSNNQHTQTQK